MYGIGFDRHGFYSNPSGGTGRNVIIFGIDMSSFRKIDNRKKYILIFGKGPTQGLKHTISTEKCIQLILQSIIKSCSTLYYCWASSYLFANSTEIHKFRAKDSEIVATPFCSGNVSKDWPANNMKRAGLNGYVYDFSVVIMLVMVMIY